MILAVILLGLTTDNPFFFSWSLSFSLYKCVCLPFVHSVCVSFEAGSACGALRVCCVFRLGTGREYGPPLFSATASPALCECVRKAKREACFNRWLLVSQFSQRYCSTTLKPVLPKSKEDNDREKETETEKEGVQYSLEN